MNWIGIDHQVDYTTVSLHEEGVQPVSVGDGLANQIPNVVRGTLWGGWALAGTDGPVPTVSRGLAEKSWEVRGTVSFWGGLRQRLREFLGDSDPWRDARFRLAITGPNATSPETRAILSTAAERIGATSPEIVPAPDAMRSLWAVTNDDGEPRSIAAVWAGPDLTEVALWQPRKGSPAAAANAAKRLVIANGDRAIRERMLREAEKHTDIVPGERGDAQRWVLRGEVELFAARVVTARQEDIVEWPGALRREFHSRPTFSRSHIESWAEMRKLAEIGDAIARFVRQSGPVDMMIIGGEGANWPSLRQGLQSLAGSHWRCGATSMGELSHGAASYCIFGSQKWSRGGLPGSSVARNEESSDARPLPSSDSPVEKKSGGEGATVPPWKK